MAVPTVTSCSPASGPIAGGTPVQIIGTDLTAASAVTFDGTNATMYSVINATNILAVVPAGSAGAGNIVVTTGEGSGTLTDGFTYGAIFATEAECASKAGENIDTTGWTSANIYQWCSEAESYINILCQHNFSDDYSSLNADVKKILTEACSNLTAVYGISYNMGGFTSRVEAENMINILWARFSHCIDLLKDDRFVNFINSETA